MLDTLLVVGLLILSCEIMFVINVTSWVLSC